MVVTSSRGRCDKQNMLDREFSRLLNSAMVVEAPQINDERIRFIAMQVGVRKEVIDGLILSIAGISSVCLATLVVIYILMVNLHPVLRMVAIFAPAANLFLGPFAALMVIKRRLFNVWQ